MRPKGRPEGESDLERVSAEGSPVSTILIVEDNEKNMKLARDVLQAKGYATLEATTGEDGVRLAREMLPDLVLMDIQLPGINGIEALRQLRADGATARIPVLAVTASVMEQDRRQITQAGFDAYVGKPINLKEFLEAVRVALAGGRQ
jgi:two-component system, cell cycle response regulator DivK